MMSICYPSQQHDLKILLVLCLIRWMAADFYFSAMPSDFSFFLSADSTLNNDEAPDQDPQTVTNLSTESAEWVELFVREMLSASNIDDAKARASRALEVLEKSIRERVTTEAAQSFQQVV